MSSFDADTFLSTTVEGEMETHFTPVDEGEYTAMIEDIAAREVTGNQGTTPVLDVMYNVLDEEVKEKMGMDKVIVRQSIFLDVEEDGRLALGQPNKNIKLGKLRDALGQNGSGPWSFHDLKGAGPLVIKVSQRADKNDPSIVYNDVQRTAAIT